MISNDSLEHNDFFQTAICALELMGKNWGKWKTWRTRHRRVLKTPAQNNVRTSHCAMGRTCAHGDTPLHAPAHNLTPNRAFFCTHGASDWEPVHDLAPTSRSVSWCWGTRHGQQLPMLHMEVCSAPCNRDGLPMASSCMRQLLCVWEWRRPHLRFERHCVQNAVPLLPGL